MMKRWIIVAVLLAISLWSANFTLAYWWAAGGPPNARPELYEQRGNIFAVGTLLLFGGAVGLAVFNLKRRVRGER
jgi:hypothetical protein